MAARTPKSDKTARSKSQSSSESADNAQRLWSAATFLLGTMLVWSMLAPQDSTSVFDGSAVPQNLFWISLAVLTSWAVCLGGWQFQFSQRQWLVLSACLLWLVVATILAGRDNNPRTAWNGFWQVISLGGCYFSARVLLVGPQTQRAMVLIMLVGCVALACHGLHQIWVELPADRARYLADPEKVLAEIPGLNAPLGSVAQKRFEDRFLYSSEPFATFTLANSLAVLLSGGMVLLLGLSLAALRAQSHLDQGNSPTTSYITLSYFALGLTAIVLLVCWFLTRSRIAYPALLAGGTYWILASGSRAREFRRYLPWGLGMGAVGLAIGLIWLLRNDSLVLSEAPKSLSYRLEYWLATLGMLQDHWLFGIGMGNYQSYYPIYKLPAASEIIADPHNWLLDILVNLSVPLGFVLIAWIGRRLLPRSQVQPDDSQSTPPTEAELLVQNTDQSRSLVLLWGAGLGGTLCALLLNLLNGMNLSNLALTWLPALLLVFLLRKRLGTDLANLRVTARAAVVTMLVCLLVSGSWQASGIAVPLLLLLVVGDAGTTAGIKLRKTSDTSDGWSKWSVSLIPLIGLLVFLFQCWRPTTSSWSLTEQAKAASTTDETLRLLVAAAAADPLNAEPTLPWQADLLVKDATLASSEQFPQIAGRALEVVETWLKMDSVKSLNWYSSGNKALELTAKARNLGLDEQKYLDLALGYYEQALARYPSNIGLRAQYAATLAIAGKWPEAGRELKTAIELDRQTPHLDKKLGSQQLWLPLLPEEAEQEFGAQQPWVDAEPITVWMRKTMAEHFE